MKIIISFILVFGLLLQVLNEPIDKPIGAIQNKRRDLLKILKTGRSRPRHYEKGLLN